MRIAITTVSKEGITLDSRFAAFKEALKTAKSEEVQLLCLPGGYFCAKSEAQVKKTESRVVQEAKRAGVAVAVGIDRSQRETPKKQKASRSSSQYQSFAVAWSPRQHKPERWPQRSSNTTNQWSVSDEDCKRPQTLPVAGEGIEVLACGELFNERIRNSVIARHPYAVVDLSHDGKGFRADRSLMLLAENGMYAFCSTHADMKSAMKRGFAPGGRKISTRETDSIITGEPRIEMKIWEV